MKRNDCTATVGKSAAAAAVSEKEQEKKVAGKNEVERSEVEATRARDEAGGK